MKNDKTLILCSECLQRLEESRNKGYKTQGFICGEMNDGKCDRCLNGHRKANKTE